MLWCKRVSVQVEKALRPCSLLILVLLLFSTFSFAQPSDLEANANQPTAPVALDGTILFAVRGVSSYPAETRAQGIIERIQAAAADDSLSVDAVRVIESEGRSTIMADTQPLMAVVDADSENEGIDRQTLAGILQARIQAAITKYRADRDPAVLMAAAWRAGGVTLLFALALFIVVRLTRGLQGKVENAVRLRIEASQSRSLQVLPVHRVYPLLNTALRTARLTATLLLGYVYAEYVLNLFPWTRPLSNDMLSILVGPLITLGTGFLESLPNLVFVAILALVVRYGIKLLRLFFEAIASQTLAFPGFDVDWAIPTYRLVRFAIIAFAAIIAYPYLPGSKSEAFKGVSLFIGVILSLGSSSAIANMIAGYSLIYRRAFKLGDRVRIGEAFGDVSAVRLQVTHVRSVKNEEVIIPNSEILNSQVINYTSLARRDGLILHTTVSIGYETPWRQVEAMLMLAAERTVGLQIEPPPFVLIKALGDFAVLYEINAHTDQAKSAARLYTALHRNILDIFNEHGVQIMTPSYESDPEVPKFVPKDKWFESPAVGSVPAAEKDQVVPVV